MYQHYAVGSFFLPNEVPPGLVAIVTPHHLLLPTLANMIVIFGGIFFDNLVSNLPEVFQLPVEDLNEQLRLIVCVNAGKASFSQNLT